MHVLDPTLLRVFDEDGKLKSEEERKEWIEDNHDRYGDFYRIVDENNKKRIQTLNSKGFVEDPKVKSPIDNTIVLVRYDAKANEAMELGKVAALRKMEKSWCGGQNKPYMKTYGTITKRKIENTEDLQSEKEYTGRKRKG